MYKVGGKKLARLGRGLNATSCAIILIDTMHMYTLICTSLAENQYFLFKMFHPRVPFFSLSLKMKIITRKFIFMRPKTFEKHL